MRLIAMLFALLALLLAELASAKLKPNLSAPPFPIQVSITRSGGSGCPDGVHAALAPGGGAISILFDNLVTEVHPGESQARATCVIGLTLGWSGPYRLAIVGSDVR